MQVQFFMQLLSAFQSIIVELNFLYFTAGVSMELWTSMDFVHSSAEVSGY